MPKSIKIYSFDVFDTCLVRTCGTPDNLFKILSHKVFTKDVPFFDRQLFVLARREAENKASTEKKNYNIYDVYKNFKYNHPLLFPISDIIRIEIETEKENTIPVFSICQKIANCRKKHTKIIFISDMYFPSNILMEILDGKGLYRNDDIIYVSCDCDARKEDGKLYKYIKNKEDICYSHWTHFGDNKISDYDIPRKLGINSNLIFWDFTTYQKQWQSNTDKFFFAINEDYKGILAGLSRAMIVNFKPHPRCLLLADVIAPLYCSFVHQVFFNAQKNGIKQLFFCARDTYHLYQIAKTFNPLFPDIKIKYLFISRKSLYEGDEVLLLKYLIQEGLANNNTKSAIVDSTTSGMTHYSLNSILSKNGFNTINKNILSFYFLNNTPLYCLENDYVAYAHNGFDNKSILLIENIFSTNNGKRVINYKKINNRVIPVFDNNTKQDICFQPNIKSLQRIQSDFLKKYASYYLKNSLHLFSAQILNNISLPTFLSFLELPHKEYTESLIDCKFYDNNTPISLIKKVSFYNLIKNKGKNTLLERATVFYNLPNWILKLFIKYKITKKY